MKYSAVLVLCVCLLSGCVSVRKPPEAGQGPAPVSYKPSRAEQWMTHYYQNPEPDKLVEALRELHDSGLTAVPTAQRPLIAFVGRVLKDNPRLVPGLVESCQFLRREEIPLLAFALWFSGTEESKQEIAKLAKDEPRYRGLLDQDPPSFADMAMTSPEELDVCWGSFFASGETSFIDRVIDCLAYRDEETDMAKILMFGAAYWSIGSNSVQHKSILDHCRAEANARTGVDRDVLMELLDTVAGKRQPRPIQQETIRKLKALKPSAS